MEGETPEENQISKDGSEKHKKKKKKKHKHRKHHEEDSEEEDKKTINKKNQAVIKDLIADCFVLLHVIYVKIYLFELKKKKKSQAKLLNLKQKVKYIKHY
jgi:hypothetical protein